MHVPTTSTLATKLRTSSLSFWLLFWFIFGCGRPVKCRSSTLSSRRTPEPGSFRDYGAKIPPEILSICLNTCNSRAPRSICRRGPGSRYKVCPAMVL
ncbi:hypothetical protein BV25DRAFT_1660835 [Artomyces pyxidatus]|uniref:Uncharacterized protein n=1 Tax=Artomyces pyxidatus TaxID=48021 RepID=A0ACB8SJE8_9AGAM|nr:hypothetical protein BV25DRAFT_1660835 [Artomyces pyxidatus]